MIDSVNSKEIIMNNRSVIVLGSLLLLSVTSTNAQIYKWKDASGQINYTALPAPKGISAETIEEKIRSAANLPNGSTKSESSRVKPLSQMLDDEDREALKEEKTKVPNELINYCSKQRVNLSLLKRNTKVNWIENGKKTPLTDEQRLDKISVIQSALDKDCKNVSSKPEAEPETKVKTQAEKKDRTVSEKE